MTAQGHSVNWLEPSRPKVAQCLTSSGPGASSYVFISINSGAHSQAPSQFQMCACLVARLWPTFCDSVDCSPPGCSAHGGSPGKNTGVGCHFLLQGIFPTHRLNPGLPHWGRFFTIWATREAQLQSQPSHAKKKAVAQFSEILAKIVGIVLPLISLWNYPAHKNQLHHILRPL